MARAQVRVEFSGLDELRRALRELPEALTTDADRIVRNRAERAASRIRNAYPVGKTGNLQNRVTVDHHGNEATRYGSYSVVRNAAPHAWWWEHGTEIRRSEFGNRGRMVGHPTFIPIAEEERRAMFSDLVALVRRAGFTVAAVDLWGQAAA